MNRWKTLKTFIVCLFLGRCGFRSCMDGDRCRLPSGHTGSHVMWHWRWLRKE